MKQLVFTDKRQSADALDELARAVRAGEARVVSSSVDGTGKLRLAITLPGSETVHRQGAR